MLLVLFFFFKKNPQLTQSLITKNNGVFFDTVITGHRKMDVDGFTAVILKFCLVGHKTDWSNCSAYDQPAPSMLA